MTDMNKAGNFTVKGPHHRYFLNCFTNFLGIARPTLDKTIMGIFVRRI